jgi:hypothetical protein
VARSVCQCEDSGEPRPLGRHLRGRGGEPNKVTMVATSMSDVQVDVGVLSCPPRVECHQP